MDFVVVTFRTLQSGMSYAPSPKKTGLPREVWKWLQGTGLSFYPKNVRRGTSLSAKQSNWGLILKALQKQNLSLVKSVIEGTIHCKPGAAELLVQEVYSILTNKSIKSVPGPELDFTDREYQEILPPVARSTASRAIKSNLTATEIIAEPDISTNQRRTNVILQRHAVHKSAEKAVYPGRFRMKPRRSPLVGKALVSSSYCDECDINPSSEDVAAKLCSTSVCCKAAASYKELKVLQPVRRSQDKEL
ncbi:spermatogenesis-associated protein 4 isoform X2 [Nelusetta ayraudi]|uniref:spermatogenesis-associated protein 4 isoform X2 n=1 Tax=Nelusetta ayraudi TaxID=303726 RepID=UPI003F72496E